jgi:2-keto-4-pentenoate hydratase/2-oxohepta-3-ene-1,7-dioic acid hydratase in catechol pathway
MRLVRVGKPGRERPCVVARDKTVRDVSDWVSDWAGDALYPEFLSELDAKIGRVVASLPEVDVSRERIGPPVQPRQILSIGLNYRNHAQEAGMALPDEPIVASKSPSAVVGAYDDLIIPPRAEKTDWEVELGVVVGRRAQYLPSPDAALRYVAGYCTANDVSERSWLLERGGQWIKGKSFESFAPLGPYLVTPEEIDGPGNLRLTCRVNGWLMQDGNTSDQVFSVEYLLYYLSQCLILEPGDVVITGSPAGIALGRPDYPYLRAGDVVEAEVQGLGVQRQHCRDHGAAVGRKRGGIDPPSRSHVRGDKRQ